MYKYDNYGKCSKTIFLRWFVNMYKYDKSDKYRQFTFPPNNSKNHSSKTS